MELNYTQQKDVRSRAVTWLLNLQPKLLLIERQNKTTQAEEPYTTQIWLILFFTTTNMCPPPPPCKKPKVFMLCVFSFNAKARPASSSLRLCLRPPLCRLAQKFRSPSLFVSLWLPACWCPTPTLSCPTCCLLRLSRRAVLRGCFRYIYTSKENSSVTE